MFARTLPGIQPIHDHATKRESPFPRVTNASTPGNCACLALSFRMMILFRVLSANHVQIPSIHSFPSSALETDIFFIFILAWISGSIDRKNIREPFSSELYQRKLILDYT